MSTHNAQHNNTRLSRLPIRKMEGLGWLPGPAARLRRWGQEGSLGDPQSPGQLQSALALGITQRTAVSGPDASELLHRCHTCHSKANHFSFVEKLL